MIKYKHMNKCHNCNKPLKKEEEYWYPVVEDSNDEVIPKAPFCKKCYLEISEPDY